MRFVIIITLLLIAAQLGAQSKLSKHYKKLVGTYPIERMTEADSLVKVTFNNVGIAKMVIVSSSKPKSYSFHTLDTGVQKEFIKAYLKEAEVDTFKSKSINDLLCYSCKTKRPSSKPPLVVRKNLYSKVFEFDVRDVLHGASKKGRIAEIIISLSLDVTADIEFLSFVNLNTKYEVVDFGNIGLTRNRNFALSAGFELAGTGSTIVSTGSTSSAIDTLNDGQRIVSMGDSRSKQNGNTTSNKGNLSTSYSTSRTITEEKKITERRIALKGNISNRSITLIQQGAPNLNLDDKIQVEVLLRSKNVITQKLFRLGRLFENNELLRDDDKLSISHYYMYAPPPGFPSTNITGTLSYRFKYREVIKKSSASNEAEHKVKFHVLEDPSLVASSVNVLEVNELKQKVYSLLKNDFSKRVWVEYLHNKELFRFDKIEVASQLLTYLILRFDGQANITEVKYKGLSLYYGSDSNTNDRLTVSDLKDLIVSVF